jgi:hypothetical protein
VLLEFFLNLFIKLFYALECIILDNFELFRLVDLFELFSALECIFFDNLYVFRKLNFFEVFAVFESTLTDLLYSVRKFDLLDVLVVFKCVRSNLFNAFRYLEFFVFLACRISDEDLLFLVEENAVFTSEFLVVFAYFKLLKTCEFAERMLWSFRCLRSFRLAACILDVSEYCSEILNAEVF